MTGINTILSPVATSDTADNPIKPKWKNRQHGSNKKSRQKSKNSLNNKKRNKRNDSNKQCRQLSEKQSKESNSSSTLSTQCISTPLSRCHDWPSVSSLLSLSSVPSSDEYCTNSSSNYDVSSGSDCGTATTVLVSDSNSGTPVEKKKKFNRKQRRTDAGKKKKQRNPSNAQRKNVNNSRRKRRTKKQCTADAAEEEKANYVAMDCEMVGVGTDGKASALARVSLVDWSNDVLLDTYVKVSEPVVDLRTSVSGVILSDIDDSDSNVNAMDFHSCVNLVQKTIQDKILVGHGLKNDLRVLGLTHPWFDIRDTAKYEPFMNIISDNTSSDSSAHGEGSSTRLLPQKLKYLAKEKLNLTIQKVDDHTRNGGHCSIEDASTAMKLYQLERTNWEKVMEYKINRTLEIEGLKHMQDQIEKLQQNDEQYGYWIH